MDKKTSGAWIIHHTQKLQGVNLPTPDYEQIGFAGKCGIVLNALAGNAEVEITNARVDALVKANGILPKLELPAILSELERQRLIDRAKTGIAVLGLTTSQTLEYTTAIFNDASPSPSELASIELAERVSELPEAQSSLAEYVSDTFKMGAQETGEILHQCEQIGFFDAENALGEPVYFNGNLFRREDMKKAAAVLSSLSSDEERRLIEMSNRLKSAGCISRSDAVNALGEQLYSKLCSIGFLDENSIGNESGVFTFVTRPAAFTKFTNSAADDAFDLAKAFVTSLTYGMTVSAYNRGQIRMIEALLGKLIAGSPVGPATAIGQDYKVLEMKGVVALTSAGNGLFYMRLLKKEVGQLALSVITEGEAGGAPLLSLPGVSATKYIGPEANRSVIRKTPAEPLKRGVAQLLNELRTGGLR